MIKIIDLTGKRFGRLTVIQLSHKIGTKKYYNCRCDCGNKMISFIGNLRSGNTKSCGCYHKHRTSEAHLIHGESMLGCKTKEYRAWNDIKTRCYNTKRKFYHHYGGRGIKVCERWINSYDNFLADMGRAASKEHSVERKDVNGHYNPVNCYWATRLEQANNKRTTLMATFKGETKSVMNWCRELSLPYDRVRQRIIRLHWDDEKALTA